MFKKFARIAKKFVKDEGGASGPEYAALLVIVAAVIAGAGTVATWVTNNFKLAGGG